MTMRSRYRKASPIRRPRRLNERPRSSARGWSSRRLLFELLEDRRLLAVDFGDAPDLLPGADTGDYRTLSTDNGPSHTTVAGLFMGGAVDGEVEALPDSQANGDDTGGAPPDDEDGVACPMVDLVLTEATAPTVSITVTNTTGGPGTLYGWIDYNGDGVFDNATERADVSVPNGLSGRTVTLAFPTVPFGAADSTFARFRLGLANDAAAANPTGAAGDGEVEDYPVWFTSASTGTVRDHQKISDTVGNLTGKLDNYDSFGTSVASLGDLDGDGVTDLAVGAIGDDDGGSARGAVWVLFLNADGSVKDHQKISDTAGGFAGILEDYDYFGISVASLGDLDGDGVTDLAVGAVGDDDGGTDRGAVWILLLNADGTVKSHQKINDIVGNFTGDLDNNDWFGFRVASLGDLDGDGIADLAAGALYDDDGGNAHGAVWALFLNADGTVKDHQKISDTHGSFSGALDDNDSFGSAIAALGDLDGDGVTDLAVGAGGDDDGGNAHGAVWVLFLEADGTVKDHQKISDTVGDFTGTLDDADEFGISLATLGDLDGDGITDLAVGADYDDDGGDAHGAVWVLFLDADGTVKDHEKISDTQGNFTGTLDNSDWFGFSVDSLGDLDGDGVTDLAVGAYGDDDGGSSRGAVWLLNLASAYDLGDAPDTAPGSSGDNYNTLKADGGPLHLVTTDLFMGGTVDGEGKALPNFQANGDDTDRALPDDEDGVASPMLDLVLTEETNPAVRVTVTNTTGSPVTLYGWIDYNKDGVFDNTTERADVPVPDGLESHTVILAFPTVPFKTAGSTFARFRLGLTSDTSAADPTGAAGAGEVEDYPVSITSISAGTVQDHQKISDTQGNFAVTLHNYHSFGASVATLGDLDGDGVTDLAVGANGDDDGESGKGAVWVLFLNADGTVKEHQKISDTEGNFTGTLSNNDRFGTSVASLGDLDGDGVTDLAVGAYLDDSGGIDRGAVWVLFLNADGTVKNHRKINNTEGGFSGILHDRDSFGTSIATLGDLDGDGVTDLAVGAREDDDGGTVSNRGAVWILFLNTDGTVKDHQKISDTQGNFTGTLENGDYFGTSVTTLGDLDGDGITDLAVGADGDGDGGTAQGAIWVLFLNANGTVKDHQKISDMAGNFTGALDNGDRFGLSLAALGDLDGDGVTDLAVGADLDDDGGHLFSNRGALWVLFLNADGTVKDHQKISDTEGNFTGTLENNDYFGTSVTTLGDLDGSGVTDLAVGAVGDDDGGSGRGAVWILNLAPPYDFGDAPDTAPGTGLKDYNTLKTNGGPYHVVSEDLFMGGTVDGDVDALPNSHANGDDTGGAQPDDEDGVACPMVDLMLAEGTAPTVSVTVTNTSDSPAKLYGWIDYDKDGVFDNTAERADAPVPNGSGGQTVTLSFPIVPSGTAGSTYARFRLGLTSDTAAADPTGPADEGEVEDYSVSITSPSTGTVQDHQKISDSHGNFNGTLNDHESFGRSVATLGDLDGDGVVDLAVGAPKDNGGGSHRGAVWVLFMNADGTVKDHQKIGDAAGGFTGELADDDYFGDSVAPLGDLDGDGITDLAVGALGDDDGGAERGAVWVLFLNVDGTVKDHQKISATHGSFTGTLDHLSRFGTSVAPLGDLDGDGITDLAVGAHWDDDGGFRHGAVWVLFLNADGTVKAHQKISDTEGGFTGTLNEWDEFGYSAAALGDLDGDGVTDLAVGARLDDDGGSSRGAVWVLFLNADGTVKDHQKISDTAGNFTGTLDDLDNFGSSVGTLGDLDGDGVTDVAVGARSDSDGGGGGSQGAVWLLFLNTDGTVKHHQKISATEGNFTGPLSGGDNFGTGVAALGDLDGDGITDLAVGADGDNDGGRDRGALWVLNLAPRVPDSLGMYNLELFYLDTTGNGVWDRVSGGDTFRNFGINPIRFVAQPVTGDWDGDGDDDLGVYNEGFFYLDTNENGVWDKVSGGDTFHDFGINLIRETATPIVGDWDGDGDDDLGLYNEEFFYLDTNGNGVWDRVSGGDTFRDFGINPIREAAVPVIGDWDGDGDDDLGVYNEEFFYLDMTENGVWDRVSGGDTFRDFGINQLRDTAQPVIGDWDGDGDDDLGIHNEGFFFLDTTENGVWDRVSGGDTFRDFGIDPIRNTGLPLAGRWTAASPLLAAGGPTAPDAAVMDLTEEQLAPILDQAIALWVGSGLDQMEVQRLEEVDVRIADLSGARLGEALGTNMTMDINAAGYGWFIDATPGASEEFDDLAAYGLVADPNGPAADRMDLLTAVLHELGHVLGHGDLDDIFSDDVMNGWLPVGVRRI